MLEVLLLTEDGETYLSNDKLLTELSELLAAVAEDVCTFNANNVT